MIRQEGNQVGIWIKLSSKIFETRKGKNLIWISTAPRKIAVMLQAFKFFKIQGLFSDAIAFHSTSLKVPPTGLCFLFWLVQEALWRSAKRNKDIEKSPQIQPKVKKRLSPTLVSNIPNTTSANFGTLCWHLCSSYLINKLYIKSKCIELYEGFRTSV